MVHENTGSSDIFDEFFYPCENKFRSSSFLFWLALSFRPLLPIQSLLLNTPATEASGIVEQGKFTLHKFEQPIGEENYEIRRDGDSLVVKMDFKFTDRGTPVPLTATFRGAQDLTPQAFEIKGQTARPVSIDEAITVDAGKVQFRTRDQAERFRCAHRTVLHHCEDTLPTTMQMLMVRYWATHGSPGATARRFQAAA